MGKGEKKGKRKPILLGDPNVFSVDRILRQRKVGTKFEYFVKWSGYPDSENSWVSQFDITPDLIEEFKRKEGGDPVNTSHIDHNRQNDSYFEEGIHNMGFNMQMQSPSEDFQLFFSSTGHAPRKK
ncbi:chromobox protein homolog 3-like [Bradysia coprophila]|uniref:chromobox protein homolog 3-like n=1 Tax=Bradysia coprophila TaxID=38358 RepID=UPI00187D906F|nr:chromobox protein homolog 3-like [Bradysia coprophila]